MIIQNVIFPKVGLCTEQSLYFRSNSELYSYLPDGIELKCNESVSFDTYFNSFSIGKWKKYTYLSNLFLNLQIEGKFQILLLHCERVNNVIYTHILDAKQFCLENMEQIKLEFPLNYSSGLFYFKIQAIGEKVKLYGGNYFTETEPITPSVNIGLAICTFKKESYVRKNMSLISRHILENHDCPARGHLSIFITDNGQTIAPASYSSPIHVFPNKNVGGTGGFTRSLLEILKNDSENFSHIIFTDDDITFEPDIFVRTYVFLTFLKLEYQHCSLGGSTLRLENMKIQHTSGDCWYGGLGLQKNVKAGYDLSKLDFLLKNEIEETVQYNAWLFSCVPLSTIRRIGLPLPIFIHRDDIEYGLRNGAPVIHLNGIGAWHSFGAAYSGSNFYYDTRNMMIANAIHYPGISEKRVIKFIRKKMINSILRFRYREVDLIFRGIEDFCKGVNWLKDQDPIELHKEIVQQGYTPVSSAELPYAVNIPAFWKSFQFGEKKVKRLVRILSLNGWLCRSKKNASVSLIYCRPINFYKVKKAIQYNQSNDTGIITEKSYREVFRLLYRYHKIKHLIYKKMESNIQDYNNRYKELVSEAFWRKYLDLPENKMLQTTDSVTSQVFLQKKKLRWIRKHFPKCYSKVSKLIYPAPYSFRAALNTHMKILGCLCLKKLHLDCLSPRMNIIKQAKNRHQGERCFIIGNGPSLRIQDLERLQNEITFASNSIYLCFDQTNWRPTYYTFIDAGGYEKLSKDRKIVCGDFPVKEAYLSSRISPPHLTGKERFCHINHGNHTAYRMLTRRLKRCDDISISIYDMFTVTNMAIEIAIYMGFKEIYLLGVDCNYSAAKMHFIETDLDNDFRQSTGKRRMMDYTVSYMRDAYACMERAAKEKGVKIYNATRGGALEVYERVDFDSIAFK